MLIACLLATHVAACENDGRILVCTRSGSQFLHSAMHLFIVALSLVGVVGSFAPHHCILSSPLQVFSSRFLPGLAVMALFSMPRNIRKGVDGYLYMA